MYTYVRTYYKPSVYFSKGSNLVSHVQGMLPCTIVTVQQEMLTNGNFDNPHFNSAK